MKPKWLPHWLLLVFDEFVAVILFAALAATFSMTKVSSLLPEWLQVSLAILFLVYATITIALKLGLRRFRRNFQDGLGPLIAQGEELDAKWQEKGLTAQREKVAELHKQSRAWVEEVCHFLCDRCGVEYKTRFLLLRGFPRILPEDFEQVESHWQQRIPNALAVLDQINAEFAKLSG